MTLVLPVSWSLATCSVVLGPVTVSPALKLPELFRNKVPPPESVNAAPPSTHWIELVVAGGRVIVAGLFMESSPAPVKAALALEGLLAAEMRAPLAPMQPDNLERLAGIVQRFRRAAPAFQEMR